jgi:hypothetical protein
LESGQRCSHCVALRQSGQASLTKSHGDLPFGAVRSAAPVSIFFIYEWINVVENEALEGDFLFFDRAEHASPPKQDSWCCASPHGGRTET